MKKIYRFIIKHYTGFIRLWCLLLIPAAFSKHFALWLSSASYAMWMLLLCGQYNGWKEED